MAPQANLVIDQYSTWSAEFIFADVNDNPIDVTGYTARMQIRDVPNGTNLYATLSSPSAGITVGTTDGTVIIKIDSSTTGAFSFTDAVYDVVITAPSGDKSRLVEGTIHLNPGVTQ